MDPRNKNFGEVDFLALHPTIQKKYDKRVEPDLFRLVNVLRLGSSLVGGWGGGCSLAGYC